MSLLVQKRNGEIVPFDRNKIQSAIMKAALSSGNQHQEDKYLKMAEEINCEIEQRFQDFLPNVENVHDIIEKHLMKNNLFEEAKAYILYRANKQKEKEDERKKTAFLRKLTVVKGDGRKVLFNPRKLRSCIEKSADGLAHIDTDRVYQESIKMIHDGIKTEDIYKALVLATTSLIETEPEYDTLSARFFLRKMRKEVFGKSTEYYSEEASTSYHDAFVTAIEVGVKNKILDERMLEFDLEKLASKIAIERDELFKYIGLQTLYERYFTKFKGKRLELPQIFFMRVAMGLALLEEDKEGKAIEFYNAISQHYIMPSTPTLFHAGLTWPQLSSCYLNYVDDDLKHIFKVYSDNAQLSKFSGGIGTSWGGVRATGANIKTTNVESQGVIPFLKISNDVTVAINRSGKRRGAACAYLPTWHLDIEDFIDLRKNTGDERRRTHDMNTANWIPDLFMKRVANEEKWTLFSPDEAPDLHELYGKKFEEAYIKYENKAKRGKLKKFKVVEASKLWRKMITSIFETGHPWICFSDPSNIRSPQDHAGVIHSSNLCTEILENTSVEETAVCNLLSLNLKKLTTTKGLDVKLTEKVIRTAINMLDNVIDINFYPTKEAEVSNKRHRPIGLGIMGLQDALFKMDLAFESEEAKSFVDYSTEFISYNAILSSSLLAAERGTYESYKGSKWDRGIMPVDTLDLLEKERGMKVLVERGETILDWDELRATVKKNGMRNSNTMAIAPTASISTIVGCYPCCEPQYANLHVKSNMSGEFTILNEYLVKDLKKAKLWNADMLNKLKYYDGDISKIDEIPDKMKQKYKGVFDIDQKVLIELAARRGKWLDQSQSLNLFVKGKSGKLISELYFYSWSMGLKTNYYLRTLGVSQIEKSTLDASYGLTQKRDQLFNGHSNGNGNGNGLIKACRLEDPTCESCQ